MRERQPEGANYRPAKAAYRDGPPAFELLLPWADERSLLVLMPAYRLSGHSVWRSPQRPAGKRET